MPRLILSLGLTFIVFILITQIKIGAVFPLEIARAQLLVFPLILLVLLWFRALPVKLLLVALLGASCGAWVAYGPPPDRSGTFLVARLPHDPLESESGVLRESFNDELVDEDVRAVRYFDEVTSQVQVRTLFQNDSNARPIIWGNKRWIELSFPRLFLETFHKPLYDTVHKFYGMNVADYVSGTGVSYWPPRDTANFLTRVLAALMDNEGDTTPEALAARELNLMDAGLMNHAWTSSEHRGFARWLLGNVQFMRAFAQDGFDPSEIRCALHTYSRALMLARSANSPELVSAILNNQGVAFKILAKHTRSRKLQAKSAAIFKRAIQVGRFKSERGEKNHGAILARENLEVIKKEREARILARGGTLSAQPRRSKKRGKK